MIKGFIERRMKNMLREISRFLVSNYRKYFVQGYFGYLEDEDELIYKSVEVFDQYIEIN